MNRLGMYWKALNGKTSLSMRTKILALCIGCTLLALFLQSVFFQYSASKIVYQQEQAASRKSLQNMQDELYTWIKSYQHDLIKVYNNTAFIRDLSAGRSPDLLRNRYDALAYNMALSDFDAAQNVNALYIYTIHNHLISYYRSANTPRFNYPKDIYVDPVQDNTAVVSSYVRSENRIMLISSYFNRSRRENVVRFVLKIYTNNVTKKIGYIVCDVDRSSFARIVAKHLYSDRQLVWLEPGGDRPAVIHGRIAGHEQSLFDSAVSKIESDTWSRSAGTRFRDFVLFERPQRNYNLSVYSLTPRYLLKEQQWILRRNVMIIALLVVAVAIIAATFLSRSLTTPLSRMVGGLERIKAGETTVRLTGLKSDEIGSLGNTINEMLDRIQALIAEEYKVTLLLKQTEYKALQAQVNPHFLYNSLNTMSSIAEAQKCLTVSSLCQALSNMFRYSIDMKDPLASVQDEIIHVKNFMYVMNVRTHHSVDLQIVMDDRLLDEKVPRLSLQPLVENALIHGLKNTHGSKKIVVDGAVKNGSVLLSVSDNGVGMNADEINRALRNPPHDALNRSSSVGLANIHARMQLLFGAAYGLTVESSVGHGSRVTLNAPRTVDGGSGA